MREGVSVLGCAGLCSGSVPMRPARERRCSMPSPYSLYGQKIREAMNVQSYVEAGMIFNELVEMSIAKGCSCREATKVERNNIVYFARHYNKETRQRVEKYFHISHSVEEAFYNERMKENRKVASAMADFAVLGKLRSRH